MNSNFETMVRHFFELREDGELYLKDCQEGYSNETSITQQVEKIQNMPVSYAEFCLRNDLFINVNPPKHEQEQSLDAAGNIVDNPIWTLFALYSEKKDIYEICIHSSRYKTTPRKYVLEPTKRLVLLKTYSKKTAENLYWEIDRQGKDNIICSTYENRKRKPKKEKGYERTRTYN